MVTERTSQTDRCDTCGTVKITFDPPLEIDDLGEILLDEVWAVFRQAWMPESKTFTYIDSLFYSEDSAREEMRRQIREASDSNGRTTRAGLYDGESWRFTDNGEEISIGKVNVRL